MTQRNEARAFLDAHLHTDTNDCILWPYATDTHGYGVIRINGHLTRPHVLACATRHGPRPPGTEAAHGPCNTPRCFNGAHLTWKTHAENLTDKNRDGTLARGSAIAQARLTAAQVLTIRSRYATGATTHRAIATEYGVSESTIRRAISGQTWAHVRPDLLATPPTRTKLLATLEVLRDDPRPHRRRP